MKTERAEVCPNCGQVEPWRVVRTMTRGMKSGRGLSPTELKRQYVKCRRCGHTSTISTRD